MNEAIGNINLTNNTLENIKIMAPLLDEASQNQVFGIMLGMVKVKNDKIPQHTLNEAG